MLSLLMPRKLLPTLQVPKLKVGKRQNNDFLSCCDDVVMMIFHTASDSIAPKQGMLLAARPLARKFPL